MADALPRSAFILGAGLGKRLRPLTEKCPKPLVPVFGKPLLTFALDHLAGLGVERFTINTHHAAGRYRELFPMEGNSGWYRDRRIDFIHEPVLLDTGGGIRNARALIGEEPFLVHNGDILSDLPIERLVERHRAHGNLATLGLRSSGGPLQVQWNADTGRVEDIGGRLDASSAPGYLFSGVYLLEPAIYEEIPEGEIVSIIPILADLIRRGARVGGALLDEGCWFDLGNREAYLAAHRYFLQNPRLRFTVAEPGWPEPVSPAARIDPDACLEGACAVGPGSVVGPGASLRDTVVWENSEIASGTSLDACIVRDQQLVQGEASGRDF